MSQDDLRKSGRSPCPSHVIEISTQSFCNAQRAITAEKALGSEREALVHRALTAEQATCALMEQQARDSAASRESLGHGMRMCCMQARLPFQPPWNKTDSRKDDKIFQPQQT